MSTELAVDKKKDLDARLKHLNETTSKNYVQPMEKVRKELIKATSPEDVQKKGIIEIALKATHNVLLLAQNLSHKNPTFGAITKNLVLSFKLGKPAKKQPQIQHVAQQSKQTKDTKPAPSTKPTPTTTTAATTTTTGTARPAFNNVYVPPNRQQGQAGQGGQRGIQTKKRGSVDGIEEVQSEQPKKHKGRGSSKFQH